MPDSVGQLWPELVLVVLLTLLLLHACKAFVEYWVVLRYVLARLAENDPGKSTHLAALTRASVSPFDRGFAAILVCGIALVCITSGYCCASGAPPVVSVLLAGGIPLVIGLRQFERERSALAPAAG